MRWSPLPRADCESWCVRAARVQLPLAALTCRSDSLHCVGRSRLANVDLELFYATYS